MDQTEVGAAGDAARRDIPRGPAQGNRDATSAPQERKSPGLITSRGQYVARHFGTQPRRGSLREVAYKAKQVVNKNVEERRRAPIEHDPEV